jgi:hypothetical protein
LHTRRKLQWKEIEIKSHNRKLQIPQTFREPGDPPNNVHLQRALANTDPWIPVPNAREPEILYCGSVTIGTTTLFCCSLTTKCSFFFSLIHFLTGYGAGKGNWSRVYVGLTKCGRWCAVKHIISAPDPDKIELEVKTMVMLHHANVVQYYADVRISSHTGAQAERKNQEKENAAYIGIPSPIQAQKGVNQAFYIAMELCEGSLEADKWAYVNKASTADRAVLSLPGVLSMHFLVVVIVLDSCSCRQRAAQSSSLRLSTVSATCTRKA